MATKAAPASPGLSQPERFLASVFRVLTDVTSAVGEGIRAHKDFGVRVRQGADPVEAAVAAIRQMDRAR